MVIKLDRIALLFLFRPICCLREQVEAFGRIYSLFGFATTDRLRRTFVVHNHEAHAICALSSGMFCYIQKMTAETMS